MVKEINENYQKKHPGKNSSTASACQGHYGLNTNPANVELSLERFISLGVEVSITELDIQAGRDHQLPEKQATTRVTCMRSCLKSSKNTPKT